MVGWAGKKSFATLGAPLSCFGVLGGGVNPGRGTRMESQGAPHL